MRKRRVTFITGPSILTFHMPVRVVIDQQNIGRQLGLVIPKVWSSDLLYQYHQKACQKCKFSGPMAKLLTQNLCMLAKESVLIRPPADYSARSSLRSTRFTNQLYLVFFFFFFPATCHAESQLPGQKLNLCPLKWKHGALTTGPPRRSHLVHSYVYGN